MTTNIKTGTTEPITAYILDSSGDPLTGVTDLYARVVRRSDNYMYDWDDSTFKAAAWTSLNKIFTEVDATNAPGLYAITGGLSTTGFSGTYVIMVIQTPGVSATLPAPEEMVVGDWADEISTTRKYMTNKRELSTTTMLTYDDNNSDVIGTQSVADTDGDVITLPTGTPATITKAT